MTPWDKELEEIFGPVGQPDYAEARLALEIAVQFQALRERRGLTQRQVAERIGRTQQAISKIENPFHGGHNLARLKEAVAALDAALDVTLVPLEDLAAYEASRPPKPALEDVRQRVESAGATKRPRNGRARPTRPQGSLRVSSRPRSPRPERKDAGDLGVPEQQVETAANG